MRIPFEHVHTIVATQVLLVGALQSALADVVARAVLALAAFDVVLAHLTQVAEQVAANLSRILAGVALYGVEALEIMLVEA